MMNQAKFVVDIEACVGCGKCVKVCPGGILRLNPSQKAEIADFKEFGWNGCWKCEHCRLSNGRHFHFRPQAGKQPPHGRLYHCGTCNGFPDCQ